MITTFADYHNRLSVTGRQRCWYARSTIRKTRVMTLTSVVASVKTHLADSMHLVDNDDISCQHLITWPNKTVNFDQNCEFDSKRLVWSFGAYFPSGQTCSLVLSLRSSNWNAFCSPPRVLPVLTSRASGADLNEQWCNFMLVLAWISLRREKIAAEFVPVPASFSSGYWDVFSWTLCPLPAGNRWQPLHRSSYSVFRRPCRPSDGKSISMRSDSKNWIALLSDSLVPFVKQNGDPRK